MTAADLPPVADRILARLYAEAIAEDEARTNAADHDACIEPHRSADGYVDCDGRPL
jgi:hypothetical protein